MCIIAAHNMIYNKQHTHTQREREREMARGCRVEHDPRARPPPDKRYSCERTTRTPRARRTGAASSVGPRGGSSFEDRRLPRTRIQLYDVHRSAGHHASRYRATMVPGSRKSVDSQRLLERHFYATSSALLLLVSDAPFFSLACCFSPGGGLQ